MNKMKTAIFCCGDHGRVIRDICNYNKKIELVCFLDDNKKMHGKIINDLEVMGEFSEAEKLMRTKGLEALIVGIGDNKIRASFYYKAKEMGLKLPNIIHP